MKIAIFYIAVVCVLMSCGNRQTDSASDKSKQSPSVASGSDTGTAASLIKNYTTRTGKTITVTESHPQGQSLSDIQVKFSGIPGDMNFKDVDPIRKVLTGDLDKNGFDEIYIITTAAGSGSYGNVIGIVSNSDKSLSKVFFPQVEEKDCKPGGAFEGYEGHDEFEIRDNSLVRTFPVKSGKASQRTISYSLKPGKTGSLSYNLTSTVN